MQDLAFFLWFQIGNQTGGGNSKLRYMQTASEPPVEDLGCLALVAWKPTDLKYRSLRR